MLRKISAAAILLLAPAFCLGAWNGTWKGLENGVASGHGYYVGGGLGADTGQFYERATVIRPRTFNVVNKTNLAAQGILGTLFGGYYYSYGMLYLGSELNVNLSSAEFFSSNDEFLNSNFSHTSYKILWHWGLSLLPGVLFYENTLFYTRLGYVSGNFKIHTTDISLRDANTMLDGIRFGFGINKNIFPQVDVRMEYDHIIYESHNQFTFDPQGFVWKHTRVNPTTNQVEFDVIYRIC